MGYTRIIQYGDITEIYRYEKNLKRDPGKLPKFAKDTPRTSEHSSAITRLLRKHRKERRTIKFRTERSKRRTKDAFFRLCHHNNLLAHSINFLTLTFAYDVKYKEATRHIAHFMERVRKNIDPIKKEVSISYISVPELTKKGRFHFHLLVYNLPPQIALSERKTRYLQRQFERGYVDIRTASYTSKGIAGYMAKYMGKAFDDERYETTRNYNCSRNIEKIRSAGGNSLDQWQTELLTGDVVHTAKYEVPYLGACNLTKYQHIYADIQIRTKITRYSESIR